MRTRTIFITYGLAAMLSLGASWASKGAAAFTSDVGCNAVNKNIYASKDDVYLNGGPAAAALDEGDYCVQVTTPGGTVLGQSHGLVHLTPLGCVQLSAIVFKASDDSAGYDNTPNHGGEYKMWICGDCSVQNTCKTDNFKVGDETALDPCTTTDIAKECESAGGANVTQAELESHVTALGGTAPYSMTFTPGPGVFPPGTTLVKVHVSDAFDSTSDCQLNVTVTGHPSIKCPDNIVQCNDAGKCSAAVTFAVTDSDNCPDGLILVCKDQNGNIVKSGDTFPLGITTVTCTDTDPSGNSSACTFTITVNDCTIGSICGWKFYDANANGSNDDGKVVAGWKVVLSGSASATTYTGSDGKYCFPNLASGTYTVTEVAPSGGSWVATTGTSCTFTIGCANGNNAANNFTCVFGNYCKVASGGLTLGFWSNKNGQALENAADFSALNACCLRNANGSDRDFTGTLAQNKTALNSWILSANAVNMAYMLSAQFTAMKLNVLHGLVNGSAFDLSSGMTINDLLSAANASLCAYPNTTATSVRNAQEKLKNCLDALNNGAAVVAPTPCPFTAKY